MTDGHRHRHVRLPLPLVRLLTRPVFSTTDPARAVDSRFAWTLRPHEHEKNEFTLSTLGILHGLTGLTLKIKDEK